METIVRTRKAMTDYIKREDALSVVNGIHPDDISDNHRKEVLACLDIIPPADVAPVVHSEWVTDWSSGYATPKCKRCGLIAPDNDHWPYCPECGAKMGVSK